jgi:hypothetical protein
MPVAACMKDLYDRLKDIGFDAKFVRARILPDWWEDSLAEVASNRAIAEMAISRMLGFPIARLRDPQTPLTLPAAASVRLKRNRGVEAADVMPSILLAERVAHGTMQALRPLPPFPGKVGPVEVRRAILAEHRQVDLKALLQFAWSRGIAVLPLTELPKGKKFSGMALFCGTTPVVVLSHGSDSPPWLAFHLAHELAHIFLGHVADGSDALADSNIDKLDQDGDEKAADEFACTVLTGEPLVEIKAIYGLTAAKLVERARAFAAKHQMDPGTVALVYGRNADRMAVAQAALNIMGLQEGARDTIVSALRRHLVDVDDLPETTQRFLSLVAAV